MNDLFKCFAKNNPDKEYKQLLLDTADLIRVLTNENDAMLCALWLKKFDAAAPKERIIRNELLRKLRNCLRMKELTPPFKKAPLDVPLLEIATNLNQLEEIEKFLPTDDVIKKYQMRSAEHRAAIAEYQSKLKTLVDLSIDENTSEQGKQNLCHCASLSSNHVENRNKLLQRVDSVESEIKELKGLLSKSRSKNKKRKRQMKEAMDQYRSITDKTNDALFEMESKLKETAMQSINEQSAQLENAFKQKCEDLRKEYRRIVDKAAEEHEKERKADAAVIEKLQRMLIGSGGGQR